MRGLFVSVERIHRPYGVLCTTTKARLLVMKMPYTKSGKSGDTVWQRARYGQICYPAFIPFNPCTPAQVAVRGNFRAVSARWRTLTQEQRDVGSPWPGPNGPSLVSARADLLAANSSSKPTFHWPIRANPRLTFPWNTPGPPNRLLGQLSAFFILPSAFNTSSQAWLSQNRTHGRGGPS